MSKSKTFVIGVLTGIAALLGCASVSPYTYYVLDPPAGFLRAKEPKDDLPITACNANDQTKAPCVVLKIEEYTKILQDMADMRDRLEVCEGKAF